MRQSIALVSPDHSLPWYISSPVTLVCILTKAAENSYDNLPVNVITEDLNRTSLHAEPERPQVSPFA
jgi:hypothetical protein